MLPKEPLGVVRTRPHYFCGTARHSWLFHLSDGSWQVVRHTCSPPWMGCWAQMWICSCNRRSCCITSRTLKQWEGIHLSVYWLHRSTSSGWWISFISWMCSSRTTTGRSMELCTSTSSSGKCWELLLRKWYLPSSMWAGHILLWVLCMYTTCRFSFLVIMRLEFYIMPSISVHSFPLGSEACLSSLILNN